MTFAILSKSTGQKIARPFNRASSVEELREIIGNYEANIACDQAGVQGWTLRRSKINAMEPEFGAKVVAANIETETPVFVSCNGTVFYAFREA